MLGKIYRNDHRMTYVYRDVAGSDSKRGNCKRYYISRIALQRMVYELYGEKMQVEDQIKTLVWDALIGALKARSGKERRERWAEWTYIWNDGYFSHGQICRFLGKKMREKLTGAIKGRKV